MPLRSYQLQALEKVQRFFDTNPNKRKVILVSPTGCHRIGQPILMASGAVKKVEDVIVGDLLVGMDSRPRTVLSLCRGEGQMYEIRPTKGASFVVNEDHILTLVETVSGKITDVSVRKWLGWSKSKKHLYKLFRRPAEFTEHPIDATPVDPYFIGVLLGDGSFSGSVSVSTPEPEILAELQAQAKKFGLSVTFSDPENTAPSYRLAQKKGGLRIRNPIAVHLDSLGLWKIKCEERFVPDVYRTGNSQQRAEVLAGLIDTDGSLSTGCIDYISKSQRLADDVTFISRSLGLAAYVTACEKFCQTGKGGTYYRVSISGDLSKIPCRVSRKKASERLQKKDPLRTGFTVDQLGIEPYYGFTLDGDGRYLLGDFTVTHNSGKTSMGAEAVKRAVAQGKRVLWLAHRRELITQASKRIAEDGLPDHGVMLAGHPAGNPNAALQVASVDTLRIRNVRPPADFIVWDECFPAGTLIGQTPIEKIRVGDIVDAYSHSEQKVCKSRVLRLFRSQPTTLVTVHFSDGSHLTCTAGHPFFTGSGYKQAFRLTPLDRVYRIQDVKTGHLRGMRRNIPDQPPQHENNTNLLYELQAQAEVCQAEGGRTSLPFLWTDSEGEGKGSIRPGSSRSCLLFGGTQNRISSSGEISKCDSGKPEVRIGTDEAKESDAFAAEQGSGIEDITCYGPQAKGAGWQWETALLSSADVSLSSVLGNRSSCVDTAEKGQRLSSFVQTRSCESGVEDRDRSGWIQSLCSDSTDAGSKEDQPIEFLGVDHIEIHEPSSDGRFGGLCPGAVVYNIEVEKHHNYFADGILVHNCHHTKAASWSQIQSEYPLAYSLGLTATPCRGDGAPLGDVFDGMVVAATIRQLQKAGYLVPCRIIAPGKLLGSRKLARDPLHEWQARAQGKQTVIFMNTLQECYALVHRLREAGAKAAVVEADTPVEERAEILAKFKAKEIQVLCNVAVLTEGWDDPGAEVGIVARSVGHLGLWMQIVGRFLRPAPGKKFATVLDLAGNVHMHGLPEAEMSFSLEGGIIQKDHDKMRICPYCGVMIESLPCIHCGKGKRVAQRVRIEEQDIFEVLRPPPGEDGRPIQKRWREDALYLARYAAHQRLEREWIYIAYQQRHGRNVEFNDRYEVDSAHQKTWLELFEEVYDPQPPVYHSWTMQQLYKRPFVDRYVRPLPSLPSLPILLK